MTRSPHTAPSGDGDETWLSIGELADAVRVSPDTLRAWERRYGRPVPHRLPSGHRRYSSVELPWLRRVTEAIALGHRAGDAVRASDDELSEWLRAGAPTENPSELEDLKALLADVRVREVRQMVEARAKELGDRRFVRDYVGPLVTDLGRQWADGKIAIRHEHSLTEILVGVLQSLRHAREPASCAPTIVLATLEGEHHALGVQMTGLRAAVAGWDVLVLGASTPVEEIVAAVQEVHASAVGISVSLFSGGPPVDRDLRQLRGLLPPAVELIVGGQGARGVRRGVAHVTYPSTFEELDDWLDLRLNPRTRPD